MPRIRAMFAAVPLGLFIALAAAPAAFAEAPASPRDPGAPPENGRSVAGGSLSILVKCPEAGGACRVVTEEAAGGGKTGRSHKPVLPKLDAPVLARWRVPQIAVDDLERDYREERVVSHVIQADADSPGMVFVERKDGTLVWAEVPLAWLERMKDEGWSFYWTTWEHPAIVVLKVCGAILYAAIMIFFAIMMGMNVRQFFDSPAKRMQRQKKESRVTFADVAGQDEAKRELAEIVEFLRDPDKFAGLGARVPKGVLMTGDPGNGKTLLARAVAGEAGVPFFHCSGSDFVEMFVGLGARRVRRMFKACRGAGRCILFIDEVDVVGRRRSGGGDGGTQEHDQTINQLLVEMDGLAVRTGIVVIAATNRPEVLDPALVRPGRLDRQIFVPKPDLEGRAAILAVHARKITLADDTNLRDVARLTPGFSGAALANLVNEAAIVAGRARKPAADMDCFLAARDKILLGEARSGSVMSDVERRAVAVHEAGHALAALRSRHSDPVHKVTIVPRGRALGLVVRLPERDHQLFSRARMLDDLVVALAGRAAEEVVFGEDVITNGATSDIEHATRLCREMAGRWGMFPELGIVNYLGTPGAVGPFGGYASDGASPLTLARVDEVVRARLDEAYARAKAILEAEKEALIAIADRLIEVETIDGAEALAIADRVGARSAAPEDRALAAVGALRIAAMDAHRLVD